MRAFGGSTAVEALRRFVAGDNDAFQVIAERYHTRVLTYLSRYFKLADLAADVTQETFFALFRQIGRQPNLWLEDGTLKPLILTIAARAAIDELRRERMRLDRETTLALSSSGGELSRAEAAVAATEIELDVRRAVAELPPDLRRVALLYFMDGYNTPEVAKLTHSSVGAVRGRIARARELLSIRLNRYSKGADHDLRPTTAGGTGEATDAGSPGLHR